jgi:hypothetical protein
MMPFEFLEPGATVADLVGSEGFINFFGKRRPSRPQRRNIISLKQTQHPTKGLLTGNSTSR